MNPASADSTVIKVAGPQPQTEELAAPKPSGGGGWSLQRWLLLIAFIFAAHISLIYFFGARQFPSVRPVTKVPQLQLANNADELIALDDPTLFALPQSADLAFLKMPEIQPSPFTWNEAPRWLPLSAGELGATFNQFMQTNYFAGYALYFKPPPKLNAPSLSFQPAFAEKSILRIEGELKQRQMINEINVPSLPDNDVIPPDRVQVLVDNAGNVISAVLLESSGFDPADQRALELARTVRFAPAPRSTVGEMIFNWRTVPIPASLANP